VQNVIGNGGIVQFRAIYCTEGQDSYQGLDAVSQPTYQSKTFIRGALRKVGQLLSGLGTQTSDSFGIAVLRIQCDLCHCKSFFSPFLKWFRVQRLVLPLTVCKGCGPDDKQSRTPPITSKWGLNDDMRAT
jgi:hypothetical protein